MLLHKPVENDSRVRREARTLVRAGHDVYVVQLAAGPAEPGRTDDGFLLASAQPLGRGRRLVPLRAYRLLYGAAIIGRALRLRPDAVHAHDAAMLAPGWAAARLARARLVYDTHELATGVPYRTRGWALLVRLVERLLVRRCDAVITVSDGIADVLRERYRLARRPFVVRNLTDLERSDDAGVPDLRALLGVERGPLVLHQGAPAADRGCEQLVRALALIEEAHLLFLGDALPGYVAGLERAAAAEGVAGRVHFLPYVPHERLLAHTAQADVGVSLLQPSCENHRLALPNKVFEYLAAGVPVVVSDLPELRRLLDSYAVGCVVDPLRPEAIARAISHTVAARKRLLPEVERAARELSWRAEAPKLIGLYDGLGRR